MSSPPAQKRGSDESPPPVPAQKRPRLPGEDRQAVPSEKSKQSAFVNSRDRLVGKSYKPVSQPQTKVLNEDDPIAPRGMRSDLGDLKGLAARFVKLEERTKQLENDGIKEDAKSKALSTEVKELRRALSSTAKDNKRLKKALDALRMELSAQVTQEDVEKLISTDQRLEDRLRLIFEMVELTGSCVMQQSKSRVAENMDALKREVLESCAGFEARLKKVEEKLSANVTKT